MKQWFKAAGVTDPQFKTKVMHFCCSRFPATKEMLPKLLTLLQSCHESDHKSTQWYHFLQMSIQDHFRTKGCCMFFGDAKQILSGEMQYDMSKFSTDTIMDTLVARAEKIAIKSATKSGP
jgi:hypothetical protein